MKKLIFTAVILVSCLTFKNANAQIHFSVGVNIGSQPDWGPTGYDHAAYYYIPDIDGYYDVSAHQYIYFENNVWVHRPYLPVRYRNYDLYRGYKVVINDRDPWLRNSAYRTRYAGFRGRRDQAIIRNSRDTRYRNHWRGVQQDERARQLDERNRNLNQRDRQLNRRDDRLDQRAHRINQRDKNEHNKDQHDKDHRDH
jgi:hypothetical protein